MKNLRKSISLFLVLTMLVGCFALAASALTAPRTYYIDSVGGNDVTVTDTVFDGCTFENGTAVSWGGNIGIAGHSKVELTDCTVSGGKVTNAANCGGGNIYQGNAKTELYLVDTTVKDGESANYGGNIRIGTGKLYLLSGLIAGGTAGGGKSPAGHSVFINSNTPVCIAVKCETDIEMLVFNKPT